MATRVKHRKSRLGCNQCKRSHAKCDELRPVCGHCSRLNRGCTWPTSATPNRSPQPAPQTQDAEADEPSADSVTLGPQDLRLLHHYILEVADWVYAGPLTTNIWRGAVVDLAFDYSFLLHGILAVSALHKAHISTGSLRNGYAAQFSDHSVRSLSLFQRAIPRISDCNCGAYFTLSGLIVVQSFGAAALDPSLSTLHEFIKCVNLIRGIRPLLDPFWDSLRSSQFAVMISNVRTPTSRSPVPQIEAIRERIRSTLLGDRLFACIAAVEQLEQVITESAQRTEERSQVSILLSWAALLPAEFVTLLQDRDELAIIIWAQSARLFRRVDHYWWVGGWSKRILDECERCLDPSEQHWLDWPRQALD